MTRKKVYFASDFHLGIDGKLTSRAREHQIVRWLHSVQEDAAAIYLVGDIFDFWFEYKSVVPKGFVRLLGKLAEIRDAGIPVYCFTGNHDMWMFHYFEEELGIPLFRNPVRHEIMGKHFFIGHGDGLGPGDYGYKFIKRIFSNPLCQWLFARLHPNFSFWIANYWSGKSRDAGPDDKRFLGEEKEWLLLFSNEQVQKEFADFFVFGHRHFPLDCTLKNGKSRYINLGDWLQFNSYAVFDGQEMQLKFFENDAGTFVKR